MKVNCYHSGICYVSNDYIRKHYHATPLHKTRPVLRASRSSRSLGLTLPIHTLIHKEPEPIPVIGVALLGRQQLPVRPG